MNSIIARLPWKSTLLIGLLNLLVGMTGAYLGLTVFSANENNPKTVETRVLSEESAIIDVAKRSQNAVVSIIVTKDVPVFKESFSNPFDEFGFFNFDFGVPQREQIGTEEQQIGAGSGFLVSADGLIITNRHVVQDEEAAYSVIMNNGEILEAKVLDRDPVYDIAVIRIDGKDLEFLALGDSEIIKVGQGVVAIGNALGEFSNTVSAGIVSGLGRSVSASSGFGQVESLTNIIQTDASINPGNSGGPLLDYTGNVIGVNVAVAQNAENIGFSIPINPIKNILESIIEYGEIVHPYLGIRYVQITPALQKANSLAYNYGALLNRGETEQDLAVIPGGPADVAGLMENDIILEVNGIKLDEKHPIQNEVQQYKVGDEITLKVSSKGKEKEVKVRLEKNPF